MSLARKLPKCPDCLSSALFTKSVRSQIYHDSVKAKTHLKAPLFLDKCSFDHTRLRYCHSREGQTDF